MSLKCDLCPSEATTGLKRVNMVGIVKFKMASEDTLKNGTNLAFVLRGKQKEGRQHWFQKCSKFCTGLHYTMYYWYQNDFQFVSFCFRISVSVIVVVVVVLVVLVMVLLLLFLF